MEQITDRAIMTILTDLNVYYIMSWIICGLLGMLMSLLVWLGANVHRRLAEISVSLSAIERDLRGDLSSLDRRVSRLEGRNHIE